MTTTLTDEQIQATAEFWADKVDRVCYNTMAEMIPKRLLHNKNFAGECYEWFEASDYHFMITRMHPEWCYTAFKDTPLALYRLAAACGMEKPVPTLKQVREGLRPIVPASGITSIEHKEVE